MIHRSNRIMSFAFRNYIRFQSQALKNSWKLICQKSGRERLSPTITFMIPVQQMLFSCFQFPAEQNAVDIHREMINTFHNRSYKTLKPDSDNV